MPDGKALLVGGHDGTRVSLWLQPLDGEARRLDLRDVDPSWLFWVDMSVGRNGAIALAGSTRIIRAKSTIWPLLTVLPDASRNSIREWLRARLVTWNR